MGINLKKKRREEECCVRYEFMDDFFILLSNVSVCPFSFFLVCRCLSHSLILQSPPHLFPALTVSPLFSPCLALFCEDQDQDQELDQERFTVTIPYIPTEYSVCVQYF